MQVTQQICVVSQKFVEKLQTMAAAEGSTQIPLNPPFLKGESFNPSLEKHALSTVEGRGRGEFCRKRRGNYVANFSDRTLDEIDK